MVLPCVSLDVSVCHCVSLYVHCRPLFVCVVCIVLCYVRVVHVCCISLNVIACSCSSVCFRVLKCVLLCLCVVCSLCQWCSLYFSCMYMCFACFPGKYVRFLVCHWSSLYLK